jgi:hypothetical protein
MLMVSGFCFYEKNSNYNKLKRRGIIADAKTTYVPKLYNADHYKLEFTTQDGKIVTSISKCNDEATFIKEYSKLKVIYLPEKPYKFWELPSFENYSVGYTFFFFFGVCGVLFTFMIYKVLSFCDNLRVKENREKLRKEFSGWRAFK